MQADSCGEQTRGRQSPLPGEAGSLHLVHSARCGCVCDMSCAGGDSRGDSAPRTHRHLLRSQTSTREAGGQCIILNNSSGTVNPPYQWGGGGSTPQIQVPRRQPTASLVLVPFRGQWSQPRCDNLLPAPCHTGSVTEGVSATLVEPGEVEPLIRHLPWKRTPPIAMYVSSEVGPSLVESFF